MSLLERAIRRGVSEAVGKAIGGAVKEAVKPAAEKYANQAAQRIQEATAAANQSMQQSGQPVERTGGAARSSGLAGLEGALGDLQRSLEGYATEAARNMKTCPSCGETTTAEKKFCPSCGARLPEQTLAEGTVCPACGKQNTIGTRFCAECGTKLPAAQAEEQAAAQENEAVLAAWASVLSGFPQWPLGGSSLQLESGEGYAQFSVTFPTAFAAQQAVEKYKEVLRQNGFREAGQYPDRDHLYKKFGGVCYHVDLEHCFEGDSETADLYFLHDEPTGGFDYVKPEKPAQKGLFGLFK